jgi:hypothetical protein
VRASESRLAVAVLGSALVFTVAVVIYRPFVNAQQLAFVPAGHGAKATYVNTGLLPLRLSAPGAKDVVLHDGQMGSINVSGSDGPTASSQRFAIAVQPAVPFAWWVILVALCFLPAGGQGLMLLLLRIRALDQAAADQHVARSV